jgi:hypothetical protein
MAGKRLQEKDTILYKRPAKAAAVNNEEERRTPCEPLVSEGRNGSYGSYDSDGS